MVFKIKREKRSFRIIVRNILMLSMLAAVIYAFNEYDIFNNYKNSLIQHTTSESHRIRKTDQEYVWVKVQTRNNIRKEYLKQQCNSSVLSFDPHKSYRHGQIGRKTLRALTTPDKSILYCRVSKAGSTFIMETIRELFHCDTNCLVNSSRRIRNLSYKKKKEEIKNAYTFVFVREPYGRLFSTYSNKFYFPKGFWYPIGTDITERYRKNPSENSLLYGHDVTFAEFIRYTVEEFEQGNIMDDHIKPMMSSCNPCHYNFDFIGKLETMTSDLQYLVDVWNTKNITNRTSILYSRSTKTFSEMKHFISTLKRLKGSDIDKHNLYQRAWRYYQITGVISKHIKMPFTEEMNINVNILQRELEFARKKSLVDASAVKTQKHEAMLQAYLTVPFKDLERLKHVVKEDCLLFGYDESPSWLFDRNTSSKMTNEFNYFIGLN